MNAPFETIMWLKSHATGKQFPVVEFSADTDMVTAGWVSLTSVLGPALVVTRFLPHEYGADSSGLGFLEVERRVNDELGRADLKCAWLLKVEERISTPKGLSFQEFRLLYRSPKLFFRDIFSQEGIAEESSRVPRAQFERDGGTIEFAEPNH
jgi:hypothetical protein